MILLGRPRACSTNEPCRIHHRQSISIMKELMNGRMVPLTVAGLERAMKLLAK